MYEEAAISSWSMSLERSHVRYLYLNRSGNGQEALRTDVDASVPAWRTEIRGTMRRTENEANEALPMRGSLLNGSYNGSSCDSSGILLATE